ncbi:MAG: NUDIX hydrolase [Gammaproteobacteria bacterium]
MVDLGLESAQLPDGQQIELEVVRHPGGAAVVALDADWRVCLLRQYRHAAGGWLWELPAGKVDSGETPETTARRELREEAGLLADRWQTLGAIITTPGFCDERIALFLAMELQTVATERQPHELIETHWLAFRTALQWCHQGEIQDAKSVIGLLLAAARLDGRDAGASP